MKAVLDDQFVKTKNAVKKDSRGRIALGADVTDDLFSVSRNKHGQYLLTPVAQIPAHEAWLWNNEEALESVRRGLQDAAAGRVQTIGSFSEFAELEVDD